MDDIEGFYHFVTGVLRAKTTDKAKISVIKREHARITKKLSKKRGK